MKAFTAIFLISLTSLVSSCALNRAKSKNLLEKRASYDDAIPELIREQNVKPIRIPSKRVLIYWYPHEMPSGDHFLGAYIDAEIHKERWEFKNKKRGKK